MELVSMKCPSCNALVVFEKGQDRCFCSHCGSQIQISDPNNKKYTYTKVDSARIKEAETRERIRQRELDLEEQRLNLERQDSQRKSLIIAVFILAAILGIIYIFHLAQINSEFREGLLSVLAILGFFLLMTIMKIVNYFFRR